MTLLKLRLMENWFYTDWKTIALSLLSLTIVYFTVIVLTRLAGLRSFSKMSAFDFAMTVAVGTLLASAATTPQPSALLAIVVFCGLFFLQWLIALLRKKWQWVAHAVDNQPILLMDGPRMLEENMRRANVSKKDLLAKLRENNVLNFSQVRAVVFETTGDVSVLHTSDETPLEADLLNGVIGKP